VRKSNLRKIILTPRERDYIIDAALGLTVAQSATRRNVAINTVKMMIRRAKAALGATTIANAVAIAIINGEITAQDLKGHTT
jgi:DNA-binding CsgD family transcriptional regulator